MQTNSTSEPFMQALLNRILCKNKHSTNPPQFSRPLTAAKGWNETSALCVILQKTIGMPELLSRSRTTAFFETYSALPPAAEKNILFSFPTENRFCLKRHYQRIQIQKTSLIARLKFPKCLTLSMPRT